MYFYEGLYVVFADPVDATNESDIGACRGCHTTRVWESEGDRLLPAQDEVYKRMVSRASQGELLDFVVVRTPVT